MQNENNQNDGIIYSSRIKERIESQNIVDGLNEMFDKTFRELKPYFEKMVREKNLLSFRAFGDWDNGLNSFHLEIFGGSLPDDPDEFIILDNSGDILDVAHFEENMFKSNVEVLKEVVNIINKQNITGKGVEFIVEIFVPVLDINYICRIVWTCDPVSQRRAEKVNRIADNN